MNDIQRKVMLAVMLALLAANVAGIAYLSKLIRDVDWSVSYYTNRGLPDRFDERFKSLESDIERIQHRASMAEYEACRARDELRLLIELTTGARRALGPINCPSIPVPPDFKGLGVGPTILAPSIPKGN